MLDGDQIDAMMLTDVGNRAEGSDFSSSSFVRF